MWSALTSEPWSESQGTLAHSPMTDSECFYTGASVPLLSPGLCLFHHIQKLAHPLLGRGWQRGSTQRIPCLKCGQWTALLSERHKIGKKDWKNLQWSKNELNLIKEKEKKGLAVHVQTCWAALACTAVNINTLFNLAPRLKMQQM